MTWNPTLFYLESLGQAFLLGVTWHMGVDAAGWRTFNLVLALGTVAVVIQKGIR